MMVTEVGEGRQKDLEESLGQGGMDGRGVEAEVVLVGGIGQQIQGHHLFGLEVE